MAETFRKQAVASVMTALMLIGGRPGLAGARPGSAMTRIDHSDHVPHNQFGEAAPNASLPSWPRDSHVRSSDPRLLKILRDGIARSPTLRDLIGVLNRSDVIVYIESRGRMRTGFSAYLVHQLVSAGSHRYLKVVVRRELVRDRLTGAMAHELQHAREVAEATHRPLQRRYAGTLQAPRFGHVRVDTQLHGDLGSRTARGRGLG